MLLLNPEEDNTLPALRNAVITGRINFKLTAIAKIRSVTDYAIADLSPSAQAGKSANVLDNKSSRLYLLNNL